MATPIVAPGGATPATAADVIERLGIDDEIAHIERGDDVTGWTAAHQPAEVAKGLTLKQMHLVMEVIAGRMGTLHQLIMLSNDPCQDQFVRGVCGDADEALAAAIGAMADESIGGDIIGDANHWNYGPHFAEEVSHA